MLTVGLVPFLVVAVVVICTPGPDTVLTVRNTIRHGHRGGRSTAAGVSAGQLVWTALATAGITGIIVVSPTALTVIRILGAGYLAALGLTMLISASRGVIIDRRRRCPEAQSVPPRADPAGSPLVQGLVSNLLNPKMPAFFVSVLPQFATEPWQMLLLGAMFSLMTLLWLFVVAVVGVALRSTPLRLQGLVPRLVEAAAGLVLTALGVRLLLDPIGARR